MGTSHAPCRTQGTRLMRKEGRHFRRLEQQEEKSFNLVAAWWADLGLDSDLDMVLS